MGFTLTGSASTLLCGVLALPQDARGWGSAALGWVRVHHRRGGWLSEGATGAVGSSGCPSCLVATGSLVQQETTF